MKRVIRYSAFFLVLLLGACSGREKAKETDAQDSVREVMPQMSVKITENPEKDGARMLESLMNCVNSNEPEKIKEIVEAYYSFYSKADEKTKREFLFAFEKGFNQLSEKQYLDWVKLVNAYRNVLGDSVGDLQGEIDASKPDSAQSK